MLKEDDIRSVREEEERRGRRPVDVAARRRDLALRRKFEEIVRNGDEGQFKHALIDVLGQIPGSPEYERSVKAWREHHRKG